MEIRRFPHFVDAAVRKICGLVVVASHYRYAFSVTRTRAVKKAASVIFLGIGANLPSPAFGPPRATCGAALERLDGQGIRIERRAPWYRSAPVPVSDQPWYVNGVVGIATNLKPDALMTALLEIERDLGRERGAPNAARTVDLDILAYDDLVIGAAAAPEQLRVPHPRMSERAFVLKPLADIAPDWHHPVDDQPITALLARLPAGQQTEVMADAPGLYGTEWSGATSV